MLNFIPLVQLFADTTYTADELKAQIDGNLDNINLFNQAHSNSNQTNILYYDSSGNLKLYDSSISLMKVAEDITGKTGYAQKIITLISDVNNKLSKNDKNEITSYIESLGLVDAEKQTTTPPASNGSSGSSGGGSAPSTPTNIILGDLFKTTEIENLITINIDKAALLTKLQTMDLTSTIKKTIKIEIPEMASGKAFNLNIPYEAVNMSKNNNVEFSIIANSISITLPTEAFAETGAKNIQLKINPLKDIQATNVDKEMRNIGIVYEFNLYSLNSDNTTSEIKDFSKNIQISMNVADQYKKSERLGAYYYNETKKIWEYIGGALNAATGKFEFTTNHFSKYAVFEYNKAFTDIKDHWAKNTIEIMAAKHIIGNRYGDTFNPATDTTRAEFAVWLVRSLGINNNAVDTNFTDVAKDAWYYKEVSIASKESLVLGSDGKFNPDMRITRQEMAIMMKRALDYSKKLDKKLSDAEKTDLLKSFTDKENIANWAVDASAELVRLKIITGRSGNKYAPLDTAQRAEAITMLKRYMDVR